MLMAAMVSAEVISVTTTGTCKIMGCVFEGNPVGSGALMLLSASGTSATDNFIKNCTFSGTVFSNPDEATLVIQDSKAIEMDDVVFHSSVRVEGQTHTFYEMNIINSNYHVSNLCFGTELLDGDNIGAKITINDNILHYYNIGSEEHSSAGWSLSFFGKSECAWATPDLAPRSQDYLDYQHNKMSAVKALKMSIFVYYTF